MAETSQLHSDMEAATAGHTQKAIEFKGTLFIHSETASAGETETPTAEYPIGQ